jgi:F-type H+-transporting ATPase subunit a
MIVLWIVTGLLVLATWLATRRKSLIPKGFQNFFEFLVESLYDTLEGILGPHMTKRTFWFFATVFIVILTSNWMGLLPFFGNITFHGEEGHPVPLLRAATADLNLPLAMATVYFFLWLFWSLTEIGPGGMIKHIFGSKGGLKPEDLGFPIVVGKMIIGLVAVIFVFVGLIELVSIMFRQVSLPMRLFGNIFAGENLLHEMGKFFGGWLITIPFYALEILVGFVQALVFMLLTAVFTNLMCAHEEGEAH